MHVIQVSSSFNRKIKYRIKYRIKYELNHRIKYNTYSSYYISIQVLLINAVTVKST